MVKRWRGWLARQPRRLWSQMQRFIRCPSSAGRRWRREFLKNSLAFSRIAGLSS